MPKKPKPLFVNRYAKVRYSQVRAAHIPRPRPNLVDADTVALGQEMAKQRQSLENEQAAERRERKKAERLSIDDLLDPSELLDDPEKYNPRSAHAEAFSPMSLVFEADAAEDLKAFLDQ